MKPIIKNSSVSQETNIAFSAVAVLTRRTTDVSEWVRIWKSDEKGWGLSDANASQKIIVTL